MNSKRSEIIKVSLTFTLAVFTMLVHNKLEYDAVYIATSDGNLYLSIAENFLNNGHFIQTSRPHEVGMIVPPGLPIIFTVLLGLTNDYTAILILQYALYGLSTVLLYKTSEHLCPRGSNVLCVAVPLMFLQACAYVKNLNPGMMLTEIYTTFALSLIVYLLLTSQKETSIKWQLCCIVLFALFLIRPATAGLLIIACFVTVVLVIEKVISIKRVLINLLIMGMILCANGLVNYSETGSIVLTENYSAISLYLANNSNTQTTSYSSDQAEDFSDEFFMQVYQDKQQTMQEKNDLLSARTKQFIIKNLGFVIRNAAVKYYQFFIDGWNGGFWIFVVALAVFFKMDRIKKTEMILLIASFLIMTGVTSFGLFIIRYASPCIPFYIVINSAFCVELLITSTEAIVRKIRINMCVKKTS